MKSGAQLANPRIRWGNLALWAAIAIGPALPALAQQSDPPSPPHQLASTLSTNDPSAAKPADPPAEEGTEAMFPISRTLASGSPARQTSSSKPIPASTLPTAARTA